MWSLPKKSVCQKHKIRDQNLGYEKRLYEKRLCGGRERGNRRLGRRASGGRSCAQQPTPPPRPGARWPFGPAAWGGPLAWRSAGPAAGRLGRRPARRAVAASDLRCLLVAWRGGHGPTRKSPDQDPRTEAQVVSSRPPRSRTVRRHQQKRSPSAADAKGGRGPERPSHGHTTQPRPIRKSSDQDPPTEAQVVCLRPLWSRMASHPQQKCNRSGGVIGSWRHSYSHKVLQPWLHLETYL